MEKEYQNFCQSMSGLETAEQKNTRQLNEYWALMPLYRVVLLQSADLPADEVIQYSQYAWSDLPERVHGRISHGVRHVSAFLAQFVRLLDEGCQGDE